MSQSHRASFFTSKGLTQTVNRWEKSKCNGIQKSFIALPLQCKELIQKAECLRKFQRLFLFSVWLCLPDFWHYFLLHIVRRTPMNIFTKQSVSNLFCLIVYCLFDKKSTDCFIKTSNYLSGNFDIWKWLKSVLTNKKTIQAQKIIKPSPTLYP